MTPQVGHTYQVSGGGQVHIDSFDPNRQPCGANPYSGSLNVKTSPLFYDENGKHTFKIQPWYDLLFDMEDEFRALSWKQPFAELMFHEKIETRTWSTNYRGWVLICSSKEPYNTETIKSICGIDQYSRIPAMELMRLRQLGKAIGIGKLVDCRKMGVKDEDRCFVKCKDPDKYGWSQSLFCHVYEEVQRIQPFDWIGARGWRKLLPEEKQAIRLVDFSR